MQATAESPMQAHAGSPMQPAAAAMPGSHLLALARRARRRRHAERQRVRRGLLQLADEAALADAWEGGAVGAVWVAGSGAARTNGSVGAAQQRAARAPAGPGRAALAAPAPRCLPSRAHGMVATRRSRRRAHGPLGGDRGRWTCPTVPSGRAWALTTRPNDDQCLGRALRCVAGSRLGLCGRRGALLGPHRAARAACCALLAALELRSVCMWAAFFASKPWRL